MHDGRTIVGLRAFSYLTKFKNKVDIYLFFDEILMMNN